MLELQEVGGQWSTPTMAMVLFRTNGVIGGEESWTWTFDEIQGRDGDGLVKEGAEAVSWGGSWE